MEHFFINIFVHPEKPIRLHFKTKEVFANALRDFHKIGDLGGVCQIADEFGVVFIAPFSAIQAVTGMSVKAWLEGEGTCNFALAYGKDEMEKSLQARKRLIDGGKEKVY
jgi:hypothetical protein